MNSEDFDRYLRLLGISRRSPSSAALAELVRAHLCIVPFENISKLYYRKHRGLRSLPDLPLYLEGIERYHFGGTCYANNFHLYSLLRHLGYDVMLCGADMQHPDVHVVTLVKVEGREFLVDAGYAAPFLKPLPRDGSEDYVLEAGADRYVLSPQDAEGCSRLTLYRNSTPKHGYTVKPVPRTIAEFASVIEDSFRPEATFMNAVLVVKFTPEGSRVLHNFNSTETIQGVTVSRNFKTLSEIAEEAARLFDMPQEMVLDALAEIPAFRDAWE